MARQTNKTATRALLIAAPVLLAGTMLSSHAAWAQPVSGIYVGLGGAANYLQDETVRLSPDFPSGRDKFDIGYGGVASAGYGFGNGVRIELEGNYRDNNLRQFSGTSFASDAGGTQKNYGAMVNALFDMDIGKSWLYPYVGIGAGYAWTDLDTHYSAADLDYGQHTGGTFGNLAYQAMFGLSLPVPWVVGLSMTAEYRFFSVLGPERFAGGGLGTAGAFGTQTGASRGNQDITSDYNHSLLVGLRYEFNPAPPPPPPAPPTEEAAPAPAASRTYLVFFDWDSSNLGDRARMIIAEAAQASTRVQTTRLEVDGYTDSSAARPGPQGEAYNQALSTKRAEAVRDELVRDGVPTTAIDIHGYGETHPLVATGPNKREPQNRRVEIVMR